MYFLVRNWFRYAREVSESPLIPDKLDLPQVAAKWLEYLKYLNEVSLSQYNVSDNWNLFYYYI